MVVNWLPRPAALDARLKGVDCALNSILTLRPSRVQYAVPGGALRGGIQRRGRDRD